MHKQGSCRLSAVNGPPTPVYEYEAKTNANVPSGMGSGAPNEGELISFKCCYLVALDDDVNLYSSALVSTFVTSFAYL